MTLDFMADGKSATRSLAMLQHGGRLNQAVRKYAIEADAWLDLSTGINPHGWPVPVLPASVYNRLPEIDDGLIVAAQNYYQTPHLLPVSGSQQAIQLLPELFRSLNLLPENPTIGIISPCYAEHAYQWQKYNYSIEHLHSDAVNDVIDKLNVLVVVNPNPDELDKSLMQ